MTSLSKCTKSPWQCRQIEVILRHFTQAMASRSTSLLFLRFDYKSLASSLHHRNKVWHIADSMALNVKRITAIQDWGTSDGKFCETRFSAPTVFVKITFSLIRERKNVHLYEKSRQDDDFVDVPLVKCPVRKRSEKEAKINYKLPFFTSICV